jgi:hypothetical protein
MEASTLKKLMIWTLLLGAAWLCPRNEHLDYGCAA